MSDLLEQTGTTINRDIVPEIRKDYLDYAMSCIVDRALPDLRDGLKPVHRRILYAAREMGLHHNTPYKKSARLVGDIIGKYHPHGDTAVYDTMVRMAQSFTLRYPLIDGQGNFGSMDGDSPAAMRYTEARLSKISRILLGDLYEDTVDFRPNYDEKEKEPVVLPSAIPTILLNGSDGIAVGMATKCPPHNITEVMRAAEYVLDNGDIDEDALFSFIKNADFPTGGHILGYESYRRAMLSGSGAITLRAVMHVETVGKNGQALVLTEFPYQVNKAKWVEDVSVLVNTGKIQGIQDIRDESSREGVRVVVFLRRDATPERVKNQLLKHTRAQINFNINMTMLNNGVPMQMGLKDVLKTFVSFRVEVIRRRTEYRLKQAEKRAHVVEGLAVVRESIDTAVSIIRGSENVEEASSKLLSYKWNSKAVADWRFKVYNELMSPVYTLDEEQVKSIMDMKLQKLTAVEKSDLDKSYSDLMSAIKTFRNILDKPDALNQVIRDEWREIIKEFGDDRLSEVVDAQSSVDDESLIEKRDVVVTYTSNGYLKSQVISDYRQQQRGGTGKSAQNVVDDDNIKTALFCSTHDDVLFFTDLGRVFKKKGYDIPIANRSSKGRYIANFLEIGGTESISAVISSVSTKFLVFLTRNGMVKRCSIDEFTNPRKSGSQSITLNDGDRLVSVIGAQNDDGSIIITTRQGKILRFPHSDIRLVSRVSKGVRSIQLKKDDVIVSADIVQETDKILTVTNKGYGKVSSVSEFSMRTKGGAPVACVKTSDKTGLAIGSFSVADGDDALFLTQQAKAIRLSLDSINETGRITQGVRLIRLDDTDSLSTVVILKAETSSADPAQDQTLLEGL